MKDRRKHLDRGEGHDRCRWDPLEAALAARWESDDRERLIGILTGLFPSKRERFMIATMIQWLGTNVGYSFLQEAFSDAGYVISAACVIAHPPAPCYVEDPMLNAMITANSFGEYFEQTKVDAVHARQMLFDLSEPQ